LNRRYPVVAEHLASRKYLLGDAFSVADAYLFTINNWATLVEFDLGRWPAIASYQARIAGREAVRKALQAEGLLS
jgi:glutathione S-transferase